MKNKIYPEGKKGRRQYEDDPEPVIFMPAYFFKKQEHHTGEKVTIKLAQEVSFLNKAAIKQTLGDLPKNTHLVIDASDSFYIDHDVLQLIKDFLNIGSKDKNIKVNLVGFRDSYKMDTLPCLVSSDEEDLVEVEGNKN